MSNSRSIFGALVIAVALFFSWPVIVGNTRKVLALRTAHEERVALLADRARIIDEARATYAEHQQKTSAGDGKKLTELVPIKRSSAEVISAVEDISRRSGVTVSQMGFSDRAGENNEPYSILTANFNMVGSYASLRLFLSELESYVRLLNVQTIDVSTDSGLNSQLAFIVRAEAYFIK